MSAVCSRLIAAGAITITLLVAPSGAAALPSDLVAAFGDNGIASFDPRPGTVRSDLAPKVVKALADGSTIVAGRTDEEDVFVAKLAAGGSLDSTFGDGGIRIFAPGVGTYDDPYGLAIDSAGRIVVGGRMDSDGFIARLTATGAMDSAWDGDGILLKTDPSGYGTISDVETEGVAVYALRSGSPARINRYTESGSPDTNFGLAGESTAASDMADTKMAISSDGRITVGGSINGAGYRFFTLRSMADGASGNYLLAPVDLTGGSYVGDFVDIAVDSTGYIYMVGGGLADGFELIRASSAGFPDYWITSAAGPGSNDRPYALSLLGSTTLVGGGTGSGAFVEARSQASAALEGTFGTGGRLAVACVGASDCPIKDLDVSGSSTALAADQNDKSVLVGRLTATGAGNGSFSGDGFDTVERRVPWNANVKDSAITADGSIYILGEAGAYGDESTFIAKHLPSGQLDTSFGSGGVIVADLRSGSPDYSNTLVVDGSGRVYVSGGYAVTTLEIWRFNSAGIDASFGTGGKASVALAGASGAGPIDMALDGDRIVVGGYDFQNPSTFRTWFQGVLASTGAPDVNFNGGVPRFVDLADGGNGEYLWQILIGPDHSVIASAKAFISPTVIKLTSGGAPDSGFGSGGVSTIGALGGIDPGSGPLIAQTAGGKLVVASTIIDTPNTMVGVTRLNADGSVDTSYGSAGVRYIGSANGVGEYVRSLVLDSEGRAVVAGDRGSGTERDSLLARFTVDGAADEQFVSGGFVRPDLSRRLAADSIVSLHVRGSEVHAVGDVVAAGLVNKVFVAAFGEPRPPVDNGQPMPTPTPTTRAVSSRIARPKGKQPLARSRFKTIRGTATATGGTLRRVQISIRRIEKGRCAFVSSKRATIRRTKTVKGKCTKPVWLTASGTAKWSFKLTRALRAGRYEIRSRASLTQGLVESTTARTGANVLTVRLK